MLSNCRTKNLNPALVSLCQYVGPNNSLIYPCVTTYNFHYLNIEEEYKLTRVYTASIIEDQIRSVSYEYSINFLNGATFFNE